MSADTISLRWITAGRLLAFFAFLGCAHAQVFTVNTVTGTHTIPCTQHEGVLFASLPQIARGVNNGDYADTITSVMIGDYAITCIAGNPFVKITDMKGKNRYYQYSVEPFAERGTLVRSHQAIFRRGCACNALCIIRPGTSIVRLALTTKAARTPHAEPPVAIEIKRESNGVQIEAQFRNAIPAGLT